MIAQARELVADARCHLGQIDTAVALIDANPGDIKNICAGSLADLLRSPEEAADNALEQLESLLDNLDNKLKEITA